MGSLHDRRSQIVVMVILFVLSLLGARLVQLQGLDSRDIAADAVALRQGQPVTLLANRGAIVDANGVELASTVERRNIFFDQQLVGSARTVNGQKREGLDEAAEDLAQALETTAAVIRPQLEGTRRFVYLARNVTPQVWRDVQALRIPGVGSQATAERVYPAGPVGGNLLGFVGQPDENHQGTGLAGIELQMQKQLAGTNGRQVYERGRQGQMIPNSTVEEVHPEDGSTVALTINRDLQWYAQQSITAQVAKVKADWGAVVVIEPKTGNILALAESPTVDPNHPAASAAENRTSKALGASFEPGSTAKLITAAAALEEGVVTPESEFVVPDRYRATNGEVFKDSHDHPDERLTFAGIMAQSSNVGTLMVGSKLDRDTRYRYLRSFGLGQPTGMQFPGQAKGVLHPVNKWDGRTGLTVLFGQGVSSTALQAVVPFATIANNGVRMQPRLVASTTTPDGKKTNTPIVTAERVVSPTTASEVRQMLSGVVAEGGTGMRAYIPGYQIAGKTGTSQAPSPKGGYSGYTGSFIGMAPADNPDLVIGVIVHKPRNGYYGGTVAGPVFQDVMSFALKQRQVQPSSNPYKLLPINY